MRENFFITLGVFSALSFGIYGCATPAAENREPANQDEVSPYAQPSPPPGPVGRPAAPGLPVGRPVGRPVPPQPPGEPLPQGLPGPVGEPVPVGLPMPIDGACKRAARNYALNKAYIDTDFVVACEVESSDASSPNERYEVTVECGDELSSYEVKTRAFIRDGRPACRIKRGRKIR